MPDTTPQDPTPTNETLNLLDQTLEGIEDLPEKLQGKTVGDLYKAYQGAVSLVGKKTGAIKEDETVKGLFNRPKQEVEDTTSNSTEDFSTQAKEAISSAFVQWQEQGSLGDETYETLTNLGIPRDVIDGYAEFQQSRMDQAQQQVNSLGAELAGEDFDQDAFFDWVADNSTQEERIFMDKQIRAGKTTFIKTLLMDYLEMKPEPKEAPANEQPEPEEKPRYKSGGGPSGRSSAFKSESEINNAIADQRYNVDMDYTEKVNKKIKQYMKSR